MSTFGPVDPCGRCHTQRQHHTPTAKVFIRYRNPDAEEVKDMDPLFGICPGFVEPVTREEFEAHREEFDARIAEISSLRDLIEAKPPTLRERVKAAVRWFRGELAFARAVDRALRIADAMIAEARR